MNHINFGPSAPHCGPQHNPATVRLTLACKYMLLYPLFLMIDSYTYIPSYPLHGLLLDQDESPGLITESNCVIVNLRPCTCGRIQQQKLLSTSVTQHCYFSIRPSCTPLSWKCFSGVSCRFSNLLVLKTQGRTSPAYQNVFLHDFDRFPCWVFMIETLPFDLNLT